MKKTKGKILSCILILVVMMTIVFPIQVFAEQVSGAVTSGIYATGTLSHDDNESATSTISLSGTSTPLMAGLTVKAAYFYRSGWQPNKDYVTNSATNVGYFLTVTAKRDDLTTRYLGAVGSFRAATGSNAWTDTITTGETWSFHW